jgi:pimeloyl-ACP methyl ester carboxylesterase
MRPDADLSPRGIARLVLAFLEALDLTDVTLVGNDTGGAICQFVLDEDPSRIGRLVLTNCDAFETFPPFPFTLLFRLGRHPALARPALSATRLAAVRNSKLGFGWLVKRRLTAAESLPWVTPYLTDLDVRRDVAAFLRAWRPADLADVATRLPAFTGPVLLCWAPADPFFTLELGRRLSETFPDARLVEIPDARTFVALDQPARLAEEIVGLVH